MSLPKCPRDGAAMRRESLGPAAALLCPECRAYWFQRADFEMLLDLPAESWKIEEATGYESEHHAGSQVSCLCSYRSTMGARYFAAVRLDACPRCEGIWIDGAELAELLRRHGGAGPELLESILHGPKGPVVPNLDG